MKRKITMLLVVVMMFTILATACSKGKDVKLEENKVEEVAKGEVEEVKELTEDEAWKLEEAYGKTIKMGFNGGLCLASLGVANPQGIYEKYGLEVEILSAERQVEALGTGKIDASGGHIAEFLVPAVNGVNYVFTTGIHTGCKTLYVLNDSDINSTSDLIGKEVAVPNGIGGSDHNIAIRMFNNDKIAPEEIKWMVVNTSAAIQAMQNGEIKAVLLTDQYAQKFVDDGTLRSLRSLTTDEDFKEETCCIFALNKDFVNNNPITAKKLTQAHKEATVWMIENVDEACVLIKDNNWGSGSMDSDKQNLLTMNFDVKDSATEQTLRNIIKDYREYKIIESEKSDQELLDIIWNPLINY